ncbi:hypothetical protein HBI64_005360 [Parastagonospora nodorum]|nr:hypothetical protein HBH46_006490 [Parastagonospora nodorum]KAH4859930.1 hypothetical protein HBH75_046780 [Parastagonospora nodorum]KAH6145296.1 hypothetical protein HBI64_005360 [Parastagonospora nodorum]
MRSHIANHSSRIAARFLQVDDATATMTNLHWNPFRRHALGGIVEETAGPARATPAPKSKTWETTVDRVPSWPEEARCLKKRNGIAYLFAVGDFILVLLPLFFVLLGVAVVTLNGKPTKDSEFGKKVEAVMDLSPTLFPIVFAAITGRSMKMIARFLAEKGTKLSNLELLMASQSVWGTVESQLLMQRLTLVGVNLLFLWALSPLGGQASLRLMQRDVKEHYTTTKIRYMTTGPAASMWGLSSTYVDSGKFADAFALYTAALMAPLSTKLGSQDPWGNVKIPTLEAFNSSTDAEGWITVPPNLSSPEAYSSLVGLPVVGLPQAAGSNFSLQYTYLFVNCSSFNQLPWPGKNGSTNVANTNNTKLEELVPGQVWFEKDEDSPFGNPIGGFVGPSNVRTSFFLDTTRTYLRSIKESDDEFDLNKGRLDGFFGNYNRTLMPQSELTNTRELVYASKHVISSDDNKYGLNIAKCALSQKHVEAIIKCQDSTCATSKIRESREDDRSSALTALEHGTILAGFVRQFPRAVGFSAGSSPTEHFIANTSSFPFVQRVGHLSSDISFADVSAVPKDVFSRRLSLAMNTFYQTSVQPTGYFGNLPQNLSLYGPDTSPVSDINVYLPANLSATNHTFYDWYAEFEIQTQIKQTFMSPFIGATTTANVTTTEGIFVCNFAWFSLLMVASIVTLATGATALVLKRLTLGPELFGFVTSMTYENPWVKIPQGGTMLDAMERARLLKDVQVYVGDVRGEEDVGHVALAAGVPLRKLERGRLYH